MPRKEFNNKFHLEISNNLKRTVAVAIVRFAYGVILMTIEQVIDNVKRLKRDYAVNDEQIIADINKVEMYIVLNVAANREGGNEIAREYGKYDLQTDRGKELLVPAPYDGIYEAFCASMIDLQYEDSERYVNDSIVYKDLLNDFTSYWYRTHRQTRYNRYYM